MRRVETPAQVEMVATEGWREALHDMHAELQQGMHDLNQELKSGAHEMAQEARAAAKELSSATRDIGRGTTLIPSSSPPDVPEAKIFIQKMPAPTAPKAAIVPLPPGTLPPGSVVTSPAIPPTEPERINRVLGWQQGGKAKGGQKPKREPRAPQPPSVDRVLAARVDYNRSTDELAAYPVDRAPNGQYVLLTDPNDPMDRYQEAYQRALILLKNHLSAAHPELSGGRNLNLPPQSWAEANGLVQQRVERLEDGQPVLALGANFSPKAVELAYNYHLGCIRTREAATGYFGGLLVLGGLGLLLRIGTGVRPSPLPKA